MKFEEAFALIKMGRFVNRPTWGHRVYLYRKPDEDIITISRNGYDRVWFPPHPDLFAEDWVEIIPHP